jgi:FPC/CPF motif-containing protein YcgG
MFNDLINNSNGGSLLTNDEAMFQLLNQAIAEEQFSCVAAKSASLQNTVVHRHYPALADIAGSARMHEDLIDYGKRRSQLSQSNATFVATFSRPVIVSETQFEELLWSHLSLLHRVDVSQGYAWAPDVSAEPEADNFSYSIGGEPYFVVGLHPCASRGTRRMPFVALAFNSHRQFNHLKSIGLYARLQKTIRAREIARYGSINPNLAEHGTASEARQYSGRPVEAGWECPFHSLHRAKKS